jgi:hypothetical protein
MSLRRSQDEEQNKIPGIEDTSPRLRSARPSERARADRKSKTERSGVIEDPSVDRAQPTLRSYYYHHNVKKVFRLCVESGGGGEKKTLGQLRRPGSATACFATPSFDARPHR